MMIMISNILLVLCWIYIAFGIVGLFRFRNVYARLLTGSKIDTAAMITLLLALMLRSESWEFSAKLLVILLFIIVTTPVGSHIIARSAFDSGLPVKLIEEEPGLTDSDSEEGGK
ncbi:monovalent cation/H(+) antiporter subunit G [Peptoclostridium sp.]|uniref:monovalent cation/H(+) antiporter subunit G n=1 Tax=Peptoclostridium sp. TaxID=1904860 RepID=UPI0025FDF69E|nr:monovalent cation/H(+) antiporter subunit G [Peptoclostridium sp.]